MLGLLTLLTIYGILLIGLDITVGYLGQVNLAQAAFLGLGAYTAALAVNSFGFGMLSALVASTLVGLLMGGSWRCHPCDWKGRSLPWLL